MFDIGASELLMIAVVAIVVIGPKDMPKALRTAGRWIAKMRKMSSHFRTGLDAMIREAEMEDMEAKWKAQNEKIMRQFPNGGPAGTEQTGAYPAAPPAPTPEALAAGPTPATPTPAQTAESAAPTSPTPASTPSGT
ncbi:MAG: Sec-independent protein translocase protein TatB [Pseudomonadota bacterium]